MFYWFNSTSFALCKVINISLSTVRCVRSAAGRGIGLKLVKGQVKTVTNIESSPRIENYGDLVRHARNSSVVDELEIEKHLTLGDEFGPGLEKSDKLYDIHLSERQQHKKFVKKMIVKRKYFKGHLETNLLTCAAKEQIRYLHKLDPIKWSPQVLSESFPISVYGVKKLLKSNYVLKCHQKIKKHDEEVFQRWKILKSGEISSDISPITQQLWRKGKLLDNNFMGNPNFPTASHSHHEVVLNKKTEEIGEYANIVKKYVDYKKLDHDKQSSSDSLISQTESNVFKLNKKYRTKCKENHECIPAKELESKNIVKQFSSKKSKEQDNVELQYHQFKENLQDEIREQNLNLDNKNEYLEWLKMQKTVETVPEKRPYDMNALFTKIQKRETDSIECQNDYESGSYPYIYDDKFGYQHPYGKSVKSKIHIPSKLYKKRALYKLGQCVYDSDGEFLYRLPKS